MTLYLMILLMADKTAPPAIRARAAKYILDRAASTFDEDDLVARLERLEMSLEKTLRDKK